MFHVSKYLDPDRTIFALDKAEHFALSAALVVMLAPLFGIPMAAFIAFVSGVTFELGQVDVLRDPSVVGKDGQPLLGKPGFGFGVFDILADAAGILTAAILMLVL